jgi:hypothetical protein
MGSRLRRFSVAGMRSYSMAKDTFLCKDIPLGLWEDLALELKS